MNSVRSPSSQTTINVVDVTIQPMNRLMCVVAWSPSTMDVDGGCTGSIAAHSAWSCDPFRSATTTFTVCRGWPEAFGAAGSGWPARHYIHKTALAGLYAHMIWSTEPDSQRQRTNWHHGSPDGKESIGRCRLLQVAAQLVAKSIYSSVPNESINNSCSSHLDGPGEPWGATWRPRGRPRRLPDGPDAPWTAPTRFPGKERG